MRILSIGNSFSTDATRYLHGAAEKCGQNIETVNLYIGGCPLSLHYQNMTKDSAAYVYEHNGQDTGRRVSIREALEEYPWDIVTLQQVSQLSVDYSTYQPYLSAIAEYVREKVPGVRLLMHETWGYRPNSQRLKEVGFSAHEHMYCTAHTAYLRAAEDIRADGILSSGIVMNALVKRIGEAAFRDDIHASLGVGRYALALGWLAALTGCDVSDNNFADFDTAVTSAEISAAKECAAVVRGQTIV